MPDAFSKDSRSANRNPFTPVITAIYNNVGATNNENLDKSRFLRII